ncbi:hypothetical protein A2Z41_00795 [Microgenomates group bacterium RBG_19FT_COMBO_39_10]|nr:MAG: hypothetical protein A2Z41_00795 [Microgenomates group bacterium RBG_19FT_COMBO_39_10]
MPLIEEFVVKMASITPDRRAAGENSSDNRITGVNQRNTKNNHSRQNFTGGENSENSNHKTS